MADAGSDERRLAFGRVAELYDRARPAYPAATMDGLIEFAGLQPGARVLEVGAGTGKATVMLADRGLAVTALEPDAAMVAVASRKCAGYPHVEIRQISFEDWHPLEPMAAVVSAQAWHWIRPEVRYARAGGTLSRGGTLASIWTFPCWATMALRGPLCDAYLETVPELPADFPMHPASRAPDVAGDWRGEIDSSDDFCDPLILRYRWSLGYSTAEYVELLQTQQDHILLDGSRQAPLLSAVARVIDAAGGAIPMDFVTQLCLARRE